MLDSGRKTNIMDAKYLRTILWLQKKEVICMFIRGFSIHWDEIQEDSYLRNIPALRGMNGFMFTHPVTFFSGENGTGKSTLLEAIAVAYGFNAEGGTRNYHFSTYDDVSDLQKAIRLIQGMRKRPSGYFFRAESFFNVATVTMTEYDDGTMPDYHAQSHGESFLHFMQRYGPEGIFIMDEPEDALSPQRQLTLLMTIHQMEQAGSQFIIATHSPILLGYPGAEILSFDDTGIHARTWEETESYRITKLFIENRDRLLQRMFESEDE